MYSQIACVASRVYGGQNKYLVTLGVQSMFAPGLWGAWPQNWAVMDDFGTLVMLGEWL